MNYAALSVLEDQAELVREYGAHAKGEPSSIVHGFPVEASRLVSSTLLTASPVYLGPQIQEMLAEAMETLPDSIPLRLEDIPFPCGFVKLGKTVMVKAGDPAAADAQDEISHIGWILREDSGAAGIHLYGHSHRRGRRATALQYLASFPWTIGSPIDDDDYVLGFAEAYAGRTITLTSRVQGLEDQKRDVTADELAAMQYGEQLESFRWIYSIWHFMAQKVASRERAYPDRAMRRRLNLEEKTEKFVDIITLRASEKRREDANREEATRHVGVRFWVRGHWRKQWYPSEGVNKPLWISSYVKGPDGAKFVGSTKLFSVTR